MKRWHTIVLVVSVLASEALPAETRALSYEEEQSLLRVVRRQNADVQVLDSYAEIQGGETTLRYARTVYPPRQIGSEGCMATALDYWAPPGPEVVWEARIEAIEYLYWSTMSDCSRVDKSKSVRISNLVDSDTLHRILGATAQVLESASEAAGRRYSGRLVALAVEYDDMEHMYFFQADYADSAECSGVRVRLRAREEIQFVRIVPTICETREYLENAR